MKIPFYCTLSEASLKINRNKIKYKGYGGGTKTENKQIKKLFFIIEQRQKQSQLPPSVQTRGVACGRGGNG